ncbi:MAG TPA: cytochrome c oxidase subunit II [Dehalococcoidia bacterium]|nr:cytochrome c oxidase subunit II [Dehalococcoidia bacterium]
MIRIVRASLPRLLPALLLAAALVLLAGCSNADPQNTFSPAGDVAAKERDLFNLVLWPAVAILIIVEGLLVVAVLRFRRRGDEGPPKQVHGNTRLEIAWTVAPAVLLLVVAVPTVASIFDVGRAPKADAFPVNAVGQRWNWKFEYPGVVDKDGKPLFTFGEMHIPADQEISVSLDSVDVIHSFWVPKLAGKLDVIPGRHNRMWLNATVPGVYSGQCAEFCGLQHYKMRFCVVAHKSLADFQAWAKTAKSGSGELQPTSCEGLSDG